MSPFDITRYQAKARLLTALRAETEALLAVAGGSGWREPTACAGWEARDIAGHLIDTTESYLASFDVARGKGQAEMPLGLDEMTAMNDERARAFRSAADQEEMVARLDACFSAVLKLCTELTEDEWAGLSVPHRYIGRIPAWAYPPLQLLECVVHRWDIQSARGRGCALSGDAVDLLVPFMLFLCQVTARVPAGTEPFSIGLAVSEPTARTYRMAVQAGGLTFEPGPVDDLSSVVEFDPASFILTVLGRCCAGTIRGSREAAETYLGLFARI